MFVNASYTYIVSYLHDKIQNFFKILNFYKSIFFFEFHFYTTNYLLQQIFLVMNKFSSKIFHASIINILFHLANIKKN